jgi:hypothetical protein
VVRAHQVQQQVDARGVARGGEDVAVVDEQDVGVQLDAGCSSRNRSACSQCVVARRPSSNPAAASTNAPVQMETIRERCAAARNACTTSAGSVPPGVVAENWTPGSSTVSAGASAEPSWSGSTVNPAEVRIGPPSRVATRTR